MRCLAMAVDATDTLSPEVTATGLPAPTAQAAAVVGSPPLEIMPEWSSYVATPSGPALGALIAVTPPESRATVVEGVEGLFFERGEWRIAQHAALLHLDRFEPPTGRSDLVKALYFADQACTLSKNDSRARLVMGRLNWERRLPLAVFYDVETARAGEARLQAETSQPVVAKVLGEAFLLEGLARAYLRDVNRAHESLIQAGRHGTLTGEAVIQLLIAAEPDFPEASMWASSLLPPDLVLGGRPGFLHKQAHRRRLISLLQTRGAGARS
jgi:hypothetical protein